MKKTFLISTVIVASVFNSAFANFFVQGAIGGASSKLEDLKSNGFSYSAGLGYNFETASNLKSALILGYAGQTTTQEKTVFENTHGKLTEKISNLNFFDLYAQIGGKVSENITLYGNFGATVADVSVNLHSNTPTIVIISEFGSEIFFGFLGGLGANYSYNKNVSFFTEINYRRATKSDLTISSFVGQVGVRYSF